MPKRKQAKKIEEQTSISILPDDGLRKIFSFLGHKERIKLERVSKKWRELLRDSWKYIEEIDMKEFDCKIPEERKTRKTSRYFSNYLPYVAAEAVWERCHPYVRTIKFPRNLEH